MVGIERWCRSNIPFIEARSDTPYTHHHDRRCNLAAVVVVEELPPDLQNIVVAHFFDGESSVVTN